MPLGKPSALLRYIQYPHTYAHIKFLQYLSIQRQSLDIPLHFLRNSKTNFKILKFSLKPSAIPGSLLRQAHLVYQLSVPPLHSQAARSHSIPWCPEILSTVKQREKPKGDSITSRTGSVFLFWFTSSFQNPTCLIQILCMHHVKGKVGKVGRRRQLPLFQRGSTEKLRECTSMTQPTVIATYFSSFRLRNSKNAPKFLNEKLSSLYVTRIKLINGENYCIVKLQQRGHCDNCWIFIAGILMRISHSITTCFRFCQ